MFLGTFRLAQDLGVRRRHAPKRLLKIGCVNRRLPASYTYGFIRMPARTSAPMPTAHVRSIGHAPEALDGRWACRGGPPTRPCAGQDTWPPLAPARRARTPSARRRRGRRRRARGPIFGDPFREHAGRRAPKVRVPILKAREATSRPRPFRCYTRIRTGPFGRSPTEKKRKKKQVRPSRRSGAWRPRRVAASKRCA